MTASTDPVASKPFRTLDAVEDLYSKCEQRFSRAPVVLAEVAGKQSERDWREAFARLQAVHPMLTLRVSKAHGRRPVFVHSREALEPVVHELTPAFSPERAMEAAMQSSFRDGSIALLRFDLFLGTEAAVVLLSFHHLLLDGTGGLRILRDLLALAGGLEVAPMPLAKLSYPQMLHLPDDWEYTAVAPELAPVPRSLQEETRELQVASRVLSSAVTAKLAAEAHAHQVSVHGVLIGAFSLAAQRLSDEERNRPFHAVTSVDCRPIFDLPDLPGCLISMIHHLLQGAGSADAEDASIWRTAQQVRGEIAAGRTRDAVMATYQGLLEAAKQESTPEQAYRVTCDAAGDLWISNYGAQRLLPAYGSLTLRRVLPASSAGGPFCQKLDVLTLDRRMALAITAQRPVAGLLDEAVRILERLASDC